MTNASPTHAPQIHPIVKAWQWIDKPILVVLLSLVAIGIFDRPELMPALENAISSFLSTLPFIIFAILAVAYVTASGAETLLSKAFSGNQVRMILFAALAGGISPFCSCEVIPFIAASLAMGVPLAAVMAFWLASPLMDPAMFLITAGGLGTDFAIAKTVAAVTIGLLGGLAVMAFNKSALFANPLKEQGSTGGGCCSAKPLSGTPEWAFWKEAPRRETFRKSFIGCSLRTSSKPS